MKMVVWITTVLLLFVGSAVAAAQHKVAPDTAYRLTFTVEGKTEGGRWAVHLRDADGNLTYDGALEEDWQRLKSGQNNYVHLFYTPANAATLELSIVPPTQDVTISEVHLERADLSSGSLLLNGDLAVNNHSGWSETYNTTITEQDGQPILFVHQNGYAFTDYIPVEVGKKYRVEDKRLNGYAPSVEAYNQLYHHAATLLKINHVEFIVPEDIAYIRLKYRTTHEHLESLRTTKVLNAALIGKSYWQRTAMLAKSLPLGSCSIG